MKELIIYIFALFGAHYIGYHIIGPILCKFLNWKDSL